MDSFQFLGISFMLFVAFVAISLELRDRQNLESNDPELADVIFNDRPKRRKPAPRPVTARRPVPRPRPAAGRVRKEVWVYDWATDGVMARNDRASLTVRDAA